MFTGLIEELGRVSGRKGRRFTFEADVVLEGTRVGDSIAVDGCCLTVVDLGPGWWAADVVDETLARTTIAARNPGDPVNLERPMRADSRVGGHFVQGHVDMVGDVVVAAPDLAVRISETPRLVAKGSVAVDGVSLTVVNAGRGVFRVAVIPHTAAVTTLGVRRPGDRVNVELDILGKYAERLLQR